MAKESTKKVKHELSKRTKFNDTLIPVIQNLASEGRDEAEIGMMLGYAGQNPKAWLKFIKNKHPEVRDAIEIGKKMADIKLVVTAFEVATGYEYDEETTTFVNVPKMNDVGKFTPNYVEKNKKVTLKRVNPDPAMLKFLLCNRLPEYFQDIKKFQVDKRTMNFKGDVTKEIKEFAGSLGKIIDAEIVETEKSDS